jgi:hypothetical protein
VVGFPAAYLIPVLGDLLVYGLALLGSGASILALFSRRRTYPSYEAYLQDSTEARTPEVQAAFVASVFKAPLYCLEMGKESGIRTSEATICSYTCMQPGYRGSRAASDA